MPQVDLESLVSACAGGSADRKITCETLAVAADGHSTDETELPDWAPESFWLSGDAEYDWWDRNAVVYERKESTKGSSINTNPNSNSNSQRFSSKNLKSKAAIIGLPKPQKTAFADAKNRRNNKHGNARLFPKRSPTVGKSDRAVVIEPSSPKVSCIGRVRSKRDRNRQLRTRQRSCSSSAAVATATVSVAAVMRQKSSSRSGRRKPGFFESVRAIFRSNRRGKPVQKPEGDSSHSTTTTKTKTKTKKRSNSRKGKGRSRASQNDASFEGSVSSEPPGLGGLNRFASGRRSESWGVGDSEIHVAQ